MALGRTDPSYYRPSASAEFKGPTKRIIVPLRTWDIKASIFGSRLEIEQQGSTIYTTQSHSWLSKKPVVTLHQGKDDKTAVAGAKLDGRGSFHIYLGDPTAKTDVGRQECNTTLGGSRAARQYKFSPPVERQAYAWRETQQKEITIADSETKSSGRDRKLISLDADGEEDELLAVLISDSKAHLRNQSWIFWVGTVSGELELWATAAAVGLLEKSRKGQGNVDLTTMAATGAGV